MKKLVFLLGVAFPVVTHAQDSYTIKMQVKMEGLPVEYAPYAEQDITTQIKGAKSKTEISSVMFSSTVYFDGDTLTVMNDAMGNKQGFVASKAELDSAEKQKSGSKPTIVYTAEKKKIAGYECTKAIITGKGKDNDTVQTVAWVTEKIKADATPRRATSRGMDLGDLKGHPLEMVMTHKSQGNNVRVLMTTKEVLTFPLADSLFKARTDGFKLIPYKQWQQQMKRQGN